MKTANDAALVKTRAANDTKRNAAIAAEAIFKTAKESAEAEYNELYVKWQDEGDATKKAALKTQMEGKKAVLDAKAKSLKESEDGNKALMTEYTRRSGRSDEASKLANEKSAFEAKKKAFEGKRDALKTLQGDLGKAQPGAKAALQTQIAEA